MFDFQLIISANYLLRETTIAAPARAAIARPTPAAAPLAAFSVLSEAAVEAVLAVVVVVVVVVVVLVVVVVEEVLLLVLLEEELLLFEFVFEEVELLSAVEELSDLESPASGLVTAPGICLLISSISTMPQNPCSESSM